MFFSGCGLRCCFCQNHDIAIGSRGRAVSVERLGEIFLELKEKGAANINLVTGAHYVPQIIEALDMPGGRVWIFRWCIIPAGMKKQKP